MGLRFQKTAAITILLVSIAFVLGTRVFDMAQRVEAVSFATDINLGNHRIINVAPPIVSTDAATKNYVDSFPFIDGSGTANYLPRWSDSNTLTNSIIQDNGTYVGIYTSPSSQYRLTVNGNVSATSYYGDGSNLTGISGLWTDAYSYIYPNNATNIVITDSGYVGIGEIGPFKKLDVSGEMRVDGAINARDSSGVSLTDQYGYMGLYVENGGQVGLNLSSWAPDYTLDLQYYNNINASSYYQNGQVFKSEVWEPKSFGSAIYYTGGRVAIGKTYANYALDVNGDINATTYFKRYYSNSYRLGMWKRESTWSDNIYYLPGSGDSVAIGSSAPNYYGCLLNVRSGTICGSTKNFVIDHPTKPGKNLVHSSLEGPEAAVYYRGEGQLQNGQAIIELPDYFEALTRKEGRTVLITPKFEEDRELIVGLVVFPVENGKFKVGAVNNSNPYQKFYWEVKAIRVDIPILEVEK